MQNDYLDTARFGVTRPVPHHFIDELNAFENAEDVDMDDDALSAIAAYKNTTDRLIVETYAEMAGNDFEVRTAATPVQAYWLRMVSPESP